MRFHSRIAARLFALCVLAVGVGPARSEDPKPSADPNADRQAVEKGLEFLQKDAAKWRKDRATLGLVRSVAR